MKILAKDICLDYPIVSSDLRSFKMSAVQTATGGLLAAGKKNIPIVKALRNVNFVLHEGDRLGLLGHNGSGKSTLLKVLAGIYSPTSGSLTTQGRIVSILNATLGMNPEATGYANIINHGLLFGLSRKQIMAKLEEIAEFTELGDYLHLPVRTYSLGMGTRTAFAVVTSVDAEILLMDEVISTGDAAFAHKAKERLNSLMSRCKILVLATHSIHSIKRLCNKALLLEHGEVLAIGDIEEVYRIYCERYGLEE